MIALFMFSPRKREQSKPADCGWSNVNTGHHIPRGGLMKSHFIAMAFALVAAQQGKPARNFDAEIRAAVQSAKTAAGTEFLGSLSRLCLLPQSGTEDTSDNVPGFVAKPAAAPARDTWYAEPARVFDN